LYVHLDNAKTTDKISVYTVYPDTADRFVACDDFVIEIPDIDDVTIGFYQVDIRVLVDYYKAFCLLAPTYLCNIGIIESVSLVVSDNALVLLVVLEERIGSPYEEIVASCLYLLDVVIRQIIAPSTHLGNAKSMLEAA
jgi:hypothetical protein